VISRISLGLYRLCNGWIAALATLIFFVFSGTLLPSQGKAAEVYSNGFPAPDTTFMYYTAVDLQTWFAGYGAAGRADYVQARYTFDLAWPLVYTFFLVAVLSWLLPKATAPTSRWRLINAAPLLALACDYIENIMGGILANSFPASNPLLANTMAFFSLTKWFFITVAFVAVAVTGIVALIKRFSKDKGELAHG
jgi:hypothetical protein